MMSGDGGIIPQKRSHRRCYVRGCPVNRQTCPNIPLHSLDKPANDLLQIWQSFCKLPDSYKFPKIFHICAAHFTRDCYSPGNHLYKGSVPTLSSTISTSCQLIPSQILDNALLQTPQKEILPVPNIRDALEEDEDLDTSCCPKFQTLQDLQNSIPFLHLPPGWVSQDPSQLPNQAIFTKFEANGRVEKSVSYIQDLAPRIHIRNEPYKPDFYSGFTDLCRHEIQYRVEKVDELKVCSETELGPPARRDNQRKPCDLVVAEDWRLSQCKTCYNSKRNIVRREKSKVAKKARYQRKSPTE